MEGACGRDSPTRRPLRLHAAQTKPSLIFRGKMGSVSCLGLGLALLLCFRQLSGGPGSVPRCWSAGATPPGTTWVRALSSGLPWCGRLGTHAVGQVAPGRGHRRSEGPRPRPRWQGVRRAALSPRALLTSQHTPRGFKPQNRAPSPSGVDVGRGLPGGSPVSASRRPGGRPRCLPSPAPGLAPWPIPSLHL